MKQLDATRAYLKPGCAIVMGSVGPFSSQFISRKIKKRNVTAVHEDVKLFKRFHLMDYSMIIGIYALHQTKPWKKLIVFEMVRMVKHMQHSTVGTC